MQLNMVKCEPQETDEDHLVTSEISCVGRDGNEPKSTKCSHRPQKFISRLGGYVTNSQVIGLEVVV